MNRDKGTNEFVENEVEIDLVELVKEVLRRWIWIVVAIIVVAAGAYIVSKRGESSSYSSTSVLYLSGSEDMDKDSESYLIGDSIQAVTSRPVLEQVVENMDLGVTYSQLAGKVSVSNPSGSRMLSITVTWSDPEMAKEIVDDVAEEAAEYIGDEIGLETPEIIQYGYVDDTNLSSSSAERSAMMGGVVGAVLAIILIIIIYLARDLVATPGDMERKTHMRVLGAFPKANGDAGATSSEPVRKFAANLSLVADGAESILVAGAMADAGVDGLVSVLKKSMGDAGIALVASPVVGTSVDAAVAAKDCDGIIIAAPCGKVSGRTVNKAKKQLTLSGTEILGAVVTGVDLKKGRYRRAYKEYVE